MDESHIEKLLFEIAGHVGNVPDDVRAVFSTLVSTTLQYRDRSKEEMGLVVTVEEVSGALDMLVNSLRTKKLPKTNDAVKLELVKLWLDALKPWL